MLTLRIAGRSSEQRWWSSRRKTTPSGSRTTWNQTGHSGDPCSGWRCYMRWVQVSNGALRGPMLKLSVRAIWGEYMNSEILCSDWRYMFVAGHSGAHFEQNTPMIISDTITSLLPKNLCVKFSILNADHVLYFRRWHCKNRSWTSLCLCRSWTTPSPCTISATNRSHPTTKTVP